MMMMMMDIINRLTLFGTITTVLIFLTIPSVSLAQAQSPPSPPFSLSPLQSPSPAPSPAVHHINISDLLTHAGPYHTFLSFLIQTNVIQTFQSQANDTRSSGGGLTLFVPADSAFSALQKTTFSNLTNDQLTTLFLYHAFPRYYTLSDFQDLSARNPVTTFAGGDCTLNVTYNMGTIHIVSDWFKAKIISSIYATSPVAIYALDMVLVPKGVFTVEPALAPAPAPAPEANPADDRNAPSSSVTGTSPTSSKSDSTTPNSSNGGRGGLLECLVLVFSGLLVMFW